MNKLDESLFFTSKEYLDSGFTTVNSKKLPLKLAANNEPLVEKINQKEIKLLKNIDM